MPTGKKILIILGIIIAVIALIIGLVFYLTKNLPQSADLFFNLIAQGKTSEAYQSTAKGFQAAMSQDAFDKFLKETNLSDFSGTSWSSRQIEDGRGYLEGTITLRNGEKIPLKIELVKENGVWKIFSLTISKAGLKETAEEPEEEKVEEEEGEKEEEIGKYLPSEAEAQELARETLILFSKAVEQKNFTDFYESVSKTWQKQISPDELYSTFESFITNEIDLTKTPSATIKFTEAPAIDDDGLLVLEGQALDVSGTAEIDLYFELTYFFEQGTWKLFGIHIKTL